MSASASQQNATLPTDASDEALGVFCDHAKSLFERQQARVERFEAELSQHIDAAIEEVSRSQMRAEEREEQAAEEQHELRERFERAVQEIRELKNRNHELSDQVTAAPSGQCVLTDEGRVNGFDWEAQKRQLMRQLETDFDASEPALDHHRLTVEDAIRITDQVIAEKDREIDALKQQLEDQASQLAEIADSSVAIAEILDQDQLILEAREELKRQQDEWREKRRQAEIDISLERARLGRERSALQGELQSIDAQRRQDTTKSKSKKADEKRPRGLWRKRLGLRDD